MEQPDFDKRIGELEIAVDRLRSLYEQYFMGIEKIEPAVVRKDVDRRIHLLRKEQIRNTALRFRFQMILQRYNTYQGHWQRICREIENGTYKRHQVRAQRRFGSVAPPAESISAPPEVMAPASIATSASHIAAPSLADANVGQGGVYPKPGGPLPRDMAAELAELDREFAPPPSRSKFPKDTRAPSSGPRPPPPPSLRPPGPSQPGPPRPPPTQRPAGSAGLSEERVRQLYADYLSARLRQKDSTVAAPFEAVAKSLRESSAKLRQKHGRDVDFEVAVRDGKTILKPFLK